MRPCKLESAEFRAMNLRIWIYDWKFDAALPGRSLLCDRSLLRCRSLLFDGLVLCDFTGTSAQPFVWSLQHLVKFDAGPQETQRHPMHFTELQMGVGIGSGTHRQMWTATTNFNPTNQDHCKKRISYETHATTIFPIVQAQRSLKLRLQQPKPSQAQRQCC